MMMMMILYLFQPNLEGFHWHYPLRSAAVRSVFKPLSETRHHWVPELTREVGVPAVPVSPHMHIHISRVAFYSMCRTTSHLHSFQ